MTDNHRIKKRIDSFLDSFKEEHGFNLAWFIRYALGGTVTVIVEFAAFFLLSSWEAPWDYMISLLPLRFRADMADELPLFAIIVSNIISYIVNYFISKYWVFRSPETRHSRDAALFFAASAANLLVVIVSAKLILSLLGLIPLSGGLWESALPMIGKVGSNVAAFITVLLFKRYIIWNDTSKY